MTQQPDPADASPALPALKIVERKVDPENPWDDDVLDREKIAKRLTDIVRGQEAPFVISLDGRWGTGKTFLLRRWQQDLENHGWQAIYFNAWEDDFNDDPLLAIIGQLSEHFDEGALREIARGVAGALGHVLVKRVTGASPDELTPDSLLNDYQEGLRTKSAVKDRLEQLGEKVRDDSGQPLLFIIDELDRCRPTFAIELLERVKHIFDVPNIVFVFGINRGELVKSLESVYGEIDAGTYLRRFFDMEFTLPDPDPAEFCRHLTRKFGLDKFLTELLRRGDNELHFGALPGMDDCLPVILKNMGLSLRDMDYCVRLLALSARDTSGFHPLYPHLFALLVAVKIKNPELYRRFIVGEARGGEVIDYFDAQRPRPREPLVSVGDEDSTLLMVEAAVYCADNYGEATTQIRSLRNGQAPPHPEYLSSAIGGMDPGKGPGSAELAHILGTIESYATKSVMPGLLRPDLAHNINLSSGYIRSY